MILHEVIKLMKSKISTEAALDRSKVNALMFAFMAITCERLKRLKLYAKPVNKQSTPRRRAKACAAPSQEAADTELTWILIHCRVSHHPPTSHLQPHNQNR